MTIYSKLPTRQTETIAAVAAATTETRRTSLQTEDPLVARETIFYDQHGRVIQDLVYYDTQTHRGKKRLRNGELKDCFIRKVRVTIGQFGINPSKIEDNVHLEAIKEVVKSRVPGQAQARMVQDIQERISRGRRLTEEEVDETLDEMRDRE